MHEQELQQQIQRLYRESYSKMVAALVSFFGLTRLSLAEDIVQETFVAALESWRFKGLPESPQAWLFRVCKNKALNALEKKVNVVKEPGVQRGFPATDTGLERIFLDHEVSDSQLRLLLACCHPAISPRTQVILILKNLVGLTVEEIARGLAMSNDAVMKTLSRSKHTLMKESMQVPFVQASRERLHIVHTAVYLLFNEGYQATQGDTHIRHELCMEAMKLMRSILSEVMLRNADSFALMALMCFHAARFDARTGTKGEIIELEQQDRSRWDAEMIALGVQYLKQCQPGATPSRYVLEAAIASVHCQAKSFEETKWPVVAGLYEKLVRVIASPIADLNYAVALYYAYGKQKAEMFLEQSDHRNWLKQHYLYYAFLAKMENASGYPSTAIMYYKKALSLTRLRAEQEFLQRKIDAITASS
jgi:RNA polymerase sigma factor (sigma-70 family)